MTMQHIETYGLSRSPILAHFQKMPKTLIILVNFTKGFGLKA